MKIPFVLSTVPGQLRGHIQWSFVVWSTLILESANCLLEMEQQSSWSQGSLCYNTWSSAFCKVNLQHDWQLVQSWAQSTQWVKTIFPPISTWWKYEIFPHFPFLFVLWCWMTCFWWADPATECCCYKSCCTHMFRGTRFTNKFYAFQKCIVQQQTLWMVPKVIVHRMQSHLFWVLPRVKKLIQK